MRLGMPPPPETTAGMAAISAPERIGAELFTTYLLPFEITGVLLLVAIVGVVVLQQRSREAKGDEVRALRPETQQQPAAPPSPEPDAPEPVAAERE
jgi:NADH-quinone oxidoreductase subunit J